MAQLRYYWVESQVWERECGRADSCEHGVQWRFGGAHQMISVENILHIIRKPEFLEIRARVMVYIFSLQ